MNSSKDFFETLLNLGSECEVTEVSILEESNRIEIVLDLRREMGVKRPECGRTFAIYDHGLERQWRHLDTMQYENRLRARLPRADCPVHGPQTVRVPWADQKTRLTLLFETQAIEVLKKARKHRSSLPPAADRLGNGRCHQGPSGEE